MSNLTSKSVYQAIWDADQAGNGVTPILSTDITTPRDDESGYVIVDWSSTDKDHKVLQAGAVIPDKGKTYEKCRALFDNYELRSSTKETETREEKKEIEDFINAIKDTPPMKLAREYLDPGQTDDEWYNSIKERWFTAFGNNDRSGFEHVIVGEDTGKFGGYHFWYKYYLDDGNDKVSDKDTIDFGSDQFRGSKGKQVPEVVTLNFQWDPNDASRNDNNVLNKPIGGFWVGCSPEGLIALGMARWKQRTLDRTEAVINRGLYKIVMYLNKDDKYIDTFYPIFKEIVDTSPEEPEKPNDEDSTGPGEDNTTRPPRPIGDEIVRIIAALVNPVNGSRGEAGLETVTLINSSDATVSLNGWRIKDKNNNGFELNSIQLKAGESQTVTLSGAPRTAQLSNKGGSITLIDSNGLVVDSVTYSRSQAREGVEVQF